MSIYVSIIYFYSGSCEWPFLQQIGAGFEFDFLHFNPFCIIINSNIQAIRFKSVEALSLLSIALISFSLPIYVGTSCYPRCGQCD